YIASFYSTTPSSTDLYTLALHDALPISLADHAVVGNRLADRAAQPRRQALQGAGRLRCCGDHGRGNPSGQAAGEAAPPVKALGSASGRSAAGGALEILCLDVAHEGSGRQGLAGGA